MKPAVTLPLAASLLLLAPGNARAQSVAELQTQIDELKGAVRALTQALAERDASAQPAPVLATPAAPVPASPAPATPASPALAQAPAAATPASPQQASAKPAPKSWYDRLRLRGYTQLRYSKIVSGDATAPATQSRLRSVQDSSITDRSNFSIRRARLVVEGDVTDRLSLYLQPDFATAVSNQSGTERREGFAQLRDAYVDWYLDKDRHLKLRLGQSKVPVGWENLQSSSNRIPLDRTDAINSAVPGERDLGVAAYYTPASVQRIWDRLAKNGQKLFGNYGAIGVGLWNGQGINRTEQDNALMFTAMITWPIEVGSQVIEIGGSGMINRVRPELRSGSVSTVSYDDKRVGLHAVLYPQPFGVQAEWTWGRGPQFDTASQQIVTAPLSGGYVQTMYRFEDSPVGPLIPYVRWQKYSGGWKAAVNAPRLESEDVELGIEWQPIRSLEITAAYSRMKRREADERRLGSAKGDVIRTQLQWSY